jgi:hypothetical protein
MPTAKDAWPAYASIVSNALQLFGPKAPRLGYFLCQFAGCYAGFDETCLEGHALAYRAGELMEAEWGLGHPDVQLNRTVLYFACTIVRDYYGLDKRQYDPRPLGYAGRFDGMPPDARPLSSFSPPRELAAEVDRRRDLIPIPKDIWSDATP